MASYEALLVDKSQGVATCASQRNIFGTALADGQLVQQKLAETFFEPHAVRLTVRQAAQERDYGEDTRVQIHCRVGPAPNLSIERFWGDKRGFLTTERPSEVRRVQVVRHVSRMYAGDQ